MLQSQLPKANATCEVCGRRYHVCHECEKMRNAGQFAWRQVVCSVQCYQVWLERKKNDEAAVRKEEVKAEKAEFDPAKVGVDSTIVADVAEEKPSKPSSQKTKPSYNFKKHK